MARTRPNMEYSFTQPRLTLEHLLPRSDTLNREPRGLFGRMSQQEGRVEGQVQTKHYDEIPPVRGLKDRELNVVPADHVPESDHELQRWTGREHYWVPGSDAGSPLRAADPPMPTYTTRQSTNDVEPPPPAAMGLNDSASSFNTSLNSIDTFEPRELSSSPTAAGGGGAFLAEHDSTSLIYEKDTDRDLRNENSIDFDPIYSRAIKWVAAMSTRKWTRSRAIEGIAANCPLILVRASLR